MTFARAGIANDRDRAAQLRRHDVDWLRVLAVLSVLVVHAAQVFSPWQSWHVQNVERSKALAAGMLVAGLWVMPLFMLLAGRSARYARASRGPRGYLRARVSRLLPPLVIGSLVVVPPQLWVRRLEDGTFSGSFIEFYPRFFDGLYPAGNLSWAHLWFLAYLLVYAIVTVPVLRRIDTSARHAADGGAPFRLAHLLLLAFASIVLQVALRAPFPQTNALLNDWANHALLLPAFFAGYLLSTSPTIEGAIVRRRQAFLMVAITLSAGIVAYAWPGEFDRRLPGSWSVDYFVFWTAIGVASWAWMFAITGYARIHLAAPSKVLQRANQLVFPFYVFHQTAVVLIAWKLVDADLPVLVEFLLLLGLAFIATTAASLAVSHARLGRLIFGIRA